MNIHIYQINAGRDTDYIVLKSYENLSEFQSSQSIRSKSYDLVFVGEVDCRTLEDVYQMFHKNYPAGYRGCFLSVFDVVEIIDPCGGESTFHYCDSNGF